MFILCVFGVTYVQILFILDRIGGLFIALINFGVLSLTGRLGWLVYVTVYVWCGGLYCMSCRYRWVIVLFVICYFFDITLCRCDL